MNRLIELTTRQSDDWLKVIEACAPYDFYHLPQYHQIAEELGEGEARLLVYQGGDYTIALPLLLRSLDALPESAVIGAGWTDATSVYGYPGPICSAASIPPDVIANFQAALLERMRERRVVTLFSRLNPFLAQDRFLHGLGEFQTTQTVSIDLTLPIAAQRTKYRRSFKESINKLRRTGLTVARDIEKKYLDDFVRIYHETMHRVDAADRYFFPASYFTELRDKLGSRLELFMCFHEGKPVCGGLVVVCHGIMQYHLGGTLNEAMHVAPMKLVVDEARLWATAQGLRILHLGGGTTPDPDDSLLYFKRGFSDRYHDFATWRWVIAPQEHALLCKENQRRRSHFGSRPAPSHYFPSYRCPLETSEPMTSLAAVQATVAQPSLDWLGEPL